MSRSVFVVIALLLTALWCSMGLAQQQGATSGQGSQGESQGVLAKADSLKGLKVIDHNGQSLGKVDSITLDLVSGNISYVDVDPGKGDKLVPVPYGAFGVMRDKRLILNADANRLDAAPSYSKRSQPNWTNQQWGQQVSAFWGKGPSGIVTGRAPSSGTAGGGQQPSAMGSGEQSPGATPQPMGQRQ